MTVKTVLMMTSMISMTINFVTMLVIFPARYGKRVSVGAFALFTIAFYLFILPLTGSMNPMYGSLRGLFFLPLIIFLFKGSLLQKVFAFFLQIVLTGIVFYLTESGVKLFIEDGTKLYYLVWFVAEFIVYALYVVLVFLFGRRAFDKLFISSRPLEWSLYIFGAIFSYVLMIISRSLPNSILQFILLVLFVLWSFGILCFAIINTHEKSKQRYEAEFARNIVSSGREHYQRINEMYDELRILRHDYKYHLVAIGKLANNNDIDGIKRHLAELKTYFPENELRLYCTNSVLNALLSNYAERCAKLNIQYDVQLAMPETLSIPNYEVCIIFGNLLENAIEACEKKERGRMIELSVKTQGKMLAVMVKNSFDGNVTEADGRPVSSKKDGGFGLRSVKAVAARYNGHILTKWDDVTFSVYVLLNT